MRMKLDHPFDKIYIRAYLREDKKDGRRRVDLVRNKYDRTTMSYARYLKSVELGEVVSDGYEVDHIDCDPSNDSLDNLQILTIEEHLEKTKLERSTGRSVTTLICPNCGIEFVKEIRLIKKGSTPKCSRRCNGEYSRKLQLGRV